MAQQQERGVLEQTAALGPHCATHHFLDLVSSQEAWPHLVSSSFLVFPVLGRGDVHGPDTGREEVIVQLV